MVGLLHFIYQILILILNTLHSRVLHLVVLRQGLDVVLLFVFDAYFLLILSFYYFFQGCLHAVKAFVNAVKFFGALVQVDLGGKKLLE